MSWQVAFSVFLGLPASLLLPTRPPLPNSLRFDTPERRYLLRTKPNIQLQAARQAQSNGQMGYTVNVLTGTAPGNYKFCQESYGTQSRLRVQA